MTTQADKNLRYFAERGTWDEVLGTFINTDGDPSQFAVRDKVFTTTLIELIPLR